MIDTKQYLINLGWEPFHAEIFLSLTKYGEQTVLQLSRNVSKPRSTLYLELEAMQRNGIITARKINKTTKYSSIQISSIKNLIEEKRRSLTQLFEEFTDFSKSVTPPTEPISTNHDITIYKGRDGIKQILWNILTSDDKEVVGFSPGTLEHVVDREFAERWRAEFKLRGKHNRIIVNKAVPLTWSKVPDFLTDKYVEVRTLEEKKIAFEHEVWFYGKTLVVISTKDDPEQYGIEITDRLLVSSYRQLFDLLWKETAKKVT
jgi:sugar-specific transcriptional regulator TrmB